MAYTRRPFNPLRPYTNQVISELNQANDNFDTLAKAFQNDDPSTLIVKHADTVDGFHASRTPAPNTIPVAGEDGKISIDWLPSEIVNRSNQTPITIDVYRLVPHWTVYIDETSPSNTTPAEFFTPGKNLTIVRWMSYGTISWHVPDWGLWSTLWTMKVRCPVERFRVPMKIVSTARYDFVYIYLNNRYVIAAGGEGYKNLNVRLNLVSGENLIQIVHNRHPIVGGVSSSVSLASVHIYIDFDWRVLEFIPT